MTVIPVGFVCKRAIQRFMTVLPIYSVCFELTRESTETLQELEPSSLCTLLPSGEAARDGTFNPLIGGCRDQILYLSL